MSNTIEVCLTIETPDGIAEARRVAPGEWQIGYPTGDDRYFGTEDQVKALMRLRIAKDYPEACWRPFIRAR